MVNDKLAFGVLALFALIAYGMALVWAWYSAKDRAVALVEEKQGKNAQTEESWHVA